MLNGKEKATINDIILTIKNLDKLYTDILHKNFTYGKGLKVLFYGPPGTGKTLSARAIAKETGRNLLTKD